MTYSPREASKLFNSKTLSSIADGDFSFIHRVSNNFLDLEFDKSKIRCIFNLTFEKLLKEYRSEYIFKNIVAQRHLVGRHSLKTATMLTEFRVGNSKADCVILNGKSTCYEIKTEYDSLARLEDQLNDYSKVFDEVFVVCSPNHIASVLKNTCEHIGVMELTSRNYLSVKRNAKYRKTTLNVPTLLKSMRKEEYIALTSRVIGQVPNVPNSQLVATCSEMLSTACNIEVGKSFVEVLKKKRLNNDRLINGLPTSLLNAAISYKFSSRQEKQLLNIFNVNKDEQCISPTSEVNSLI